MDASFYLMSDQVRYSLSESKPSKSKRMFNELAMVLSHGKVLMGLIGFVLVGVVDGIVPEGSVESWTSKAILAAIALYMIKQLAQERKEAKEDRENFGKSRDNREEKMDQIMEGNSSALKTLTEKVTAQTEYFGMMMKKMFDNDKK